jgi:5'-3' exonuclease
MSVRFRLNQKQLFFCCFKPNHNALKQVTEEARRKKREENRKKALSALREGNASEANNYFQMSSNITPQMAAEVTLC